MRQRSSHIIAANMSLMMISSGINQSNDPVHKLKSIHRQAKRRFGAQSMMQRAKHSALQAPEFQQPEDNQICIQHRRIGVGRSQQCLR
jgi:hypothetical protein